MTAELEPLRPPTNDERDLVRFLVSRDFPEYLERMDALSVRTDCICGCGSFDVVWDGEVREGAGSGPTDSAWNEDRHIELWFWLTDGIPSNVEIVYYSDQPNGVPPLAGFEWQA